MGKTTSLTYEHETEWGNINSALITAFDNNRNKTSLFVFADVIPIYFTEKEICGFF